MPGQFVVRPLDLDRVAQAFPLVSILEPGVSYEEWRDYAEASIASAEAGLGHGMITVQSAQGHIFGLSSYRIVRDLKRRRVFVIENFAVVDLLGSKRAARALLQALAALARKHGCTCLSLGPLDPAMRSSLHAGERPPGDIFSHLGFHIPGLSHRSAAAAQMLRSPGPYRGPGAGAG